MVCDTFGQPFKKRYESLVLVPLNCEIASSSLHEGNSGAAGVWLFTIARFKELYQLAGIPAKSNLDSR